ncbi:MAG TPA: hypothetical protein VFC44_10025 [Candidatus Saccharimonadales bacterium]|nr:hypothetical protein [Candidatus Saccharimonadales bacterium]
MENDWASENLQVIRTLMESSAIYRRALAPVMGLVGVTGIAAGVLGAFLNFETSRRFVTYWMAVAILCLAGAFLMVRRQAFSAHESFWSPPTRRVAQAVWPAFFAAAVIGIVFFKMGATDRPTVLLLVPVWMVLYGLAMHGAGFFMPRGARIFGWGFIGFGLVLFAHLVEVRTFRIPLADFPFANATMGVMFGGGHGAYSLYLYFTEQRGKVA